MAAKNGKAKLVGVIGDPISHSFSPMIHEYWLRQYDMNAAYVPLHVSPALFEQVIRLYTQTGFVGFNVTLPHKQEAFRLAHSLDEPAAECKAVNTLVVRRGQLHGMNTDSFGFAQQYQDIVENHYRSAPETILMLGSGGAARAIIHALGKQNVKELMIANRTLDKAIALCEEMERAARGMTLTPVALEKADYSARQADMLINTISLDAAQKTLFTQIIHNVPRTSAVIDISYGRNGTEMTKMASERGHYTEDGLKMLLWQAVPGFEQWFGIMPEVTDTLLDYVRQQA